MDANIVAIVILLLFGGGNSVGYMLRKRERQEDQSLQEQRWAQLEVRLDEIESKLDREYLLREPHLKRHAVQDARMDSHDRRLNSLEARMDQLERK